VLLLLATLLVVVVIVGVTVAISQPDASMPEAERDAPHMGLPEEGLMTPDDVDRVRFSVALRGYRMSDVDEALDRLRQEIAARDARIRELEAAGAADVPAIDDEPDAVDEREPSDEIAGGVGVPRVEGSGSTDMTPPG